MIGFIQTIVTGIDVPISLLSAIYIDVQIRFAGSTERETNLLGKGGLL